MLKFNLKKIREKVGISQRELARRISMSGQMISKIERGETTPSLETVEKIATTLGVSINDLVLPESMRKSLEMQSTMVKSMQNSLRQIEIMKAIADNDIAHILKYREKVLYNGHLLNAEERQRVLDMLKLLFPEYQDEEE